MLAYLPDQPEALDSDRFLDAHQASQNPCVIISASNVSEISVDIPWNSFQLLYDMETIALPAYDTQIAYASLWVISPLRVIANTSTPSCNLEVWAQFTNPEVCGVRVPSGSSEVYTGMGKFGKVFSQMGDTWIERERRSGKHTLSGIAEAASQMAYTMSVIPVVGPYATGVATVLKFVTTGLKWLGLSKPSDVSAAQKMLPETCDNTALGCGLDVTQKLAMDPENYVGNTFKSFGQERDYDLIHNLQMIPMWWKSFSFTHDSEEDSLIFETNVWPFHEVLTSDPPYFLHRLTHAGHIGMQHVYWRGGMKYSFRIAANRHTTARLRFVHYSGDTLPATIATGGRILSKIVDVCGTTVVSFTVPYLDPKLYKYCPNTWYDQDVYDEIYMNGKIGVYVVNRMCVPNSTIDTTVDVSVWVAGAEDLMFYMPRNNVTVFEEGTKKVMPVARNKVYSQMEGNPNPKNRSKNASVKKENNLEAAAQDLPTHNPREYFMNSFEGIVPTDAILLQHVSHGEELRRMSQFLSRYRVLYHSLGATFAAAPYRQSISFYYELGQISSIYQRSDVWADMLSMYHRFRGSIRYIIVPISGLDDVRIFASNSSEGAGIDQQPADLVQMFNYGSVFTDFITRQPLKCEVPYYSRMPWTTFAYGADHEFENTLYIEFHPKNRLSTAAFEFMILASVGEDWMCGYAVAPPQYRQLDELKEKKASLAQIKRKTLN